MQKDSSLKKMLLKISEIKETRDFEAKMQKTRMKPTATLGNFSHRRDTAKETKMKQFFTTEQISKYHPDKYADQISDALLTEILKQDKNGRVGIETMVKGNTVILGGEVKTTATIPYRETVLMVARDLNYEVDSIINLVGQQSPEINKAVDTTELGAGDQGLMFGYATAETESYLPFAFHTANQIIKTIEKDVKRNRIMKGDAKTQVSTNQDGTISSILISACHFDNVSLKNLTEHILDLFPRYADKIIVNPAGVWTIGGATADCGLTGRKIVCDQYGGFAPVGGGAFSGKDPSKVDRSGSYMARYIAVDLLKRYSLKNATVQLGYGIGIAEPLFVSAEADGRDFTKYVRDNYPLKPQGMIDYLKLTAVDYYKLAGGCHYFSPKGLNF